MRAYVGDLFGARHVARVLAFCERLPSPGDDVTLDESVRGALVLRGTGRTVWLSGRVRVEAGLVCGACLRRFRQTFDVPVDEEFGRPEVEMGTVSRDGPRAGPRARGRGAHASRPGPAALAPRGERELGPDDFLTPVGPADMIDVTEVVRQHVVLVLPIAPRCAPDCRGLCARCGADLNVAPCACGAEDMDPRLAALRRWRGPGFVGTPEGT